MLSALVHQDTVFFTYKPHIAKYYNGQSEIIKYKEPETFICGLVDHKENIWFGGREGLYSLKGSQLSKMPFLQDKFVQAIVQYSPGKVFMSTLKGLVMWNLEKYLMEDVIEYRLFDHSNGFTGIEPDQHGLFIDSRERLWITSATHLSYTYPEERAF